MLTEELFKQYLKNWKIYDKCIDKINEVLNGKYSSGLYESEWNNAVGIMLDTFINSHFTEEGCDLVNAYLFEPPLVIHEKDIFGEKEINIDDLDTLWKYLISHNYIYA